MDAEKMEKQDSSKGAMATDASMSDDSGCGDHSDKRESERFAIAHDESRHVFYMKAIVFFVLISATVAVMLVVYFYITTSETEQLEQQFSEYADSVLEGIGTSLDATFSSLDGLALSIVSYARASNQTWPFVTVPDWAQRVAKVLPFSKSMSLGIIQVVTQEQRLEWEVYSVGPHAYEDIDKSLEVLETDPNYFGPVPDSYEMYGVIYGDFGDVPYNTTSRMFPSWQWYPNVPIWYPPYNYDYASTQDNDACFNTIDNATIEVSPPYMLPDPNDPVAMEETQLWAEYYADFLNPDENPNEPVSEIYFPVIDSDLSSIEPDPEESKAVAILVGTFYWRSMFSDLLPIGSNGVVVVTESKCSPSFTYVINGPTAEYLGRGNLCEPRFRHMCVQSKVEDLDGFKIRDSNEYTGPDLDSERCPLTFHVCPSTILEDTYRTNNAAYFMLGAMGIFIFTTLVFVVYDLSVERRQKVVLSSAEKSSAVVSSLFPEQVRDRLYEQNKDDEAPSKKKTFSLSNAPSSGTNSELTPYSSAPIAQLYPETTVMFCDIAGFTAWSSVRDPTQVFTLLECLYGSFDKLAKKRGVFKVETIGDSYVAVVGLPTPRKHHAVIASRFAADCHVKATKLLNELEPTLGPGTNELAFRFGLNSGPTTAGVLRGEKGRFQLFGDTVNTAARMESNGSKNRIHVSQKTADLLVAAGKGGWVQARQELIEAKGKGKMQTYWVTPAASSQSADPLTDNSSLFDLNSISGLETDSNEETTADEKKLQRLIDWHSETLEGILLQLQADRKCNQSGGGQMETAESSITTSQSKLCPREETADVIALPCYKDKSQPLSSTQTQTPVELESKVKSQLSSYISAIAHLYRDNHFHNFEHATHVALTTKKVLSRVLNPAQYKEEEGSTDCKDMHRMMYGKLCDPLMAFALLIAAVIHDVDHPGVPNQQLVKEGLPLAKQYENKSVAEQNSCDIAWRMLHQPAFGDLRACLFQNDSDLQRFRQVIVNAVMATDIFDKELKTFRENRWAKVFSAGTKGSSSTDDEEANRRTTIVIEHLIQAADVSHAMQHWHVYQKWNERLFQEMWLAYESGRADKDPSENWYEGELWFFDNYVIPLAKKLGECGVFGVSCDEFLNDARDNREEWKAKGRAIVQGWLHDNNRGMDFSSATC